jgi:hypothetical protein
MISTHRLMRIQWRFSQKHQRYADHSCWRPSYLLSVGGPAPKLANKEQYRAGGLYQVQSLGVLQNFAIRNVASANMAQPVASLS